MSKHTAGPWKVMKSIRSSGWVITKELDDKKNVILAEVFPNYGDEEENAKLISAAPCLLEALIKRVEDGESAAFEDWLTSSKPSGDAENVHRQWLRSSNYSDFRLEWYQELEAIAKATGGE